MSVTEQQAVVPSMTPTPDSGALATSATPPGGRPPRRSDWAEAVARLRAGTGTEPGRLRLMGAVIVVLLLTFGLVASWQLSSRSDHTTSVIASSQRLSKDAALIYRSLADANTTAASGFLAGSNEDSTVRDRYDKDIKTAAKLITRAAATSKGSQHANKQLKTLSQRLPVYTGLVESARTYNRQGLPVGGAYLRHADEQMRDILLPAARKLYNAESDQLKQDQQSARSLPWLTLLLGVAVLTVLVWAQRRHFLRTNRVFNRGLVAATTAAAVLLLWILGGQLLARHHLDEANDSGAVSLEALNKALFKALETRGDEGMALVTRGAGAEYVQDHKKNMADLAGKDPEAAESGLLYDAAQLADDEEGRAPVRSALRNAGFWHYRSGEVRKLEDSGDYSQAVAMVIGSRGTTGETFDKVDAGLRTAINHEQEQFTTAAKHGKAALFGLSAGAVVLVLLGAAGTVVGISRRLAEYR